MNAYNSEVPAKYVRESGRESADRVQSTPGTREQFLETENDARTTMTKTLNILTGTGGLLDF